MRLLSFRYIKFIDYLDGFKSEKLGFYLSFSLHLLFLLFAIGFPNFFNNKPIAIPIIIPIEIINISEITSIPEEIKKADDVKKVEKKKIQIKENKFNASDNQEIKQIKIKDNLKIDSQENKKKITLKEVVSIKEKKEPIIDLDNKKILIDINNIESLPSKKIKPKLKPKEKEFNIKQKPKSDLIIKAETKQKKEEEFNIASMLKDLRNEKSIQKLEGEIEEKKENIVEKIDNQIAQLSISEIDLVLQQLSRCFIAPAGAKIKKTMFVKISAKIQKNRRVYVNTIRIVDTNIPKSSPIYGPITESAMRTLLNPDCIPLKLPEDKYELWQNLTMKFDYSVMRGG